MFKNLKRVSYYTLDVEKAKEWYVSFLNITPAYESSMAAIFKIGESTMTLAKVPSIPAGDALMPAIYWEVDDVDRCYARLIELGAEPKMPPKTILSLRMAQVVDPFGNILGISNRIQPDASQSIENQPSKTAHSVALFRSLLSKDKSLGNRMYDPYSELFLEKDARNGLANESTRQSMLSKTLGRSFYSYFIARSAFFDEAFTRALKRMTPQIVFLGAGYDTRALRFQNDLGATKIFEIDAESTQKRKKEIMLAANALLSPRVAFISMNFNKDDLFTKLADAGFDKSLPALFIWEGVAYYLSQRTIDGMLRLLSENAASGSGLCFDYAVRKLDPITAGEPFLSWMDPSTLSSRLGQYGFRLIDHLDADAMSARYLALADGTFAEKPFSAIHLAYAER